MYNSPSHKEMNNHDEAAQLKVEQVERVPNLSVIDFQARYLDVEKPVLIENAIKDWPAKKWTLNSLKEKAGHNMVFVRQNTREDCYKTGEKYNIESMKFSQYIENVERNNKKAENTYLAVQNIKKALPELDADLRIPPYIQKVHRGPYLWLAREGHYEFCHFDPDDNFLVVLSGKKYIRLYPAANLQNLYPHALGSQGKTIQSCVDCDRPDFSKYPKFSESTCYECIVNEGDMLFFPAFWWHQVTSTQRTISVNIFFGNKGSNAYLTKVMTGNQWPCFRYWLLNIIEQNRNKEQFRKVLQYLPETLEAFLMKQWHEIPTEEQRNILVQTVLDYCNLKSLPQKSDKVKHPPMLKIRGLLWRS